MNQNQIQVWKNTFEVYKAQITKNFALSEAKFKQLIHQETKKLLQNLPQGLDKNQLLTLLQEIFGSKNFQNGKYKGGKEVIIETIYEFFGKENFTNGKFTGGWNEKQDQEAIEKALQPFKDWTQTQKETELQTKQLIETKLGGSEKFQDGVFQIEKETIQIVEKAFENKGVLLRKLRNIIGEKEFFSEEPGEGIPPGREGMRVDPEAIALQQAEQKARIEAIEKWRDFYEDHGIVDANEKLFWSNKYGSNVKTAEGVYKDAILKAAEIVGEDKPLNDLEKNRINKATTPEKIKEVLEDIPKQRKEKEWNNFFEKHDILNNIDPTWQTNWKNSNLSIEVAKLIYNNGWYNSPNDLIGDDKKIETCTTKTDVKGKTYEKTIQKIDPLKHLASEVKDAHDFIVKEIDLQTDLNKFPTNETIEGAYNEKKVPDTINHEEVQNLRDKRIKELFKQYFQGNSPTNLTENEIELWRTSETGLPNTGKDQRTAYDNGWTNPKEIKNGKVDYQNITEISVLEVKKQDIDQEINKVNQLVQQINNYKYLRELDANQSAIDKQFKELKTELLPPNKSQEIKVAEENQRKNLFYSLTDPQDGGLEESILKKLAANLQNTWNVPNYEPMTVEKLNAFIAADKDVQALGLFKPETKWEDLTQSDWLKQQGGYEIPKEKTSAEDKLDISQKGTHLLKFFYDKCKDGKGYPFNPDKLTDPQIHFCQIGTKMVKKFKKKTFGKGEWIEEPTEVIGGDKGAAGHLAIGTGIGKSTKVINCLCKGGQRHIILVTTNQTLVGSAFKHNTGWLQEWGCVFHGGTKGETEMVYVRRGTMERASEEDIKLGKHDPEMKSLYKSHGTYPVAKNDLAYWYNANTGQNEGLEPGKKGLSIMYFGHLLGFAARNLFVESGGINSWTNEEEKRKVKEKLIPKDDTIIVFDEADYNDAGFQALQFEMIKEGYKCIRMSATFPGVEFSATSTYPRKIMYTGRLDPNMPAGLMRIRNSEHAEKLETMRGLPPGTIKWQDENGQPIFLEVNTEEMIQTGRIWIFLKNLNLSDEQVRILGNNTSYMLYSSEHDENCEEITYGRPSGSADGVGGDKDRGVSPKIDGVICLGATETTNLQKFFTYSEPTLGITSKPSAIQIFGRVGRHDPGLVITLIKEFGEIDLSDNVSASMVKANFDGNIKQINDKEYKQIYDIDILRGALSYPDPKIFGKAPEEILIGLKITKDQQSKKEKLTQLVWRQDNEEDKKEALTKPWYAFMDKEINPSEKLWNRYLGKSDKITMGEETAKNLLKEMISNFIAQDRKYPQGLDLKNQAKFISSVFGAKLDGNRKEEVIKETRTVLNGLVEAKVNELAAKDYDETNRRSKNPNTIKKLAGLYKLTDATIDYQKRTK